MIVESIVCGIIELGSCWIVQYYYNFMVCGQIYNLKLEPTSYSFILY